MTLPPAASPAQRHSTPSRDILEWTIPGALAALAGALVWYTTRLGVVVSPDSVVYLDGARHLAAGAGFASITRTGAIAPVTHFPPLYPALLALPVAMGLPATAAARVLAVLVFAALVFSVAWVVSRTSRSLAGGALAGGLVALGGPFTPLAASAWTEVPALLALTWTLYGLQLGLTGSRRALLCGAGAAAVGALLRYAGVVGIGFGALALVLRSGWSRREKIKATALWLAISATPLALWLVRNHLASGNSADRHFAWHIITADTLRSAATTLMLWVGRPDLPHLVTPLLALVLVAWIAGGLARGRRAFDGVTLATWLGYAAAYLLFLALSLSTMDKGSPTDDRILAPVLLAGYVAMGLAASGWLVGRRRAERAWGGAMVALGIALLLGRAGWGLTEAQRLHRSSDFYTAYAVHRSPVLAAVRAGAATPATLYTNDFFGTYWLTGHRATQLPIVLDATTGLANPDLPAELRRMAAALACGAQVLELPVNYWGSLSVPSLRRTVPLRAVAADPIATLYAAAAPPERCPEP